MSDYSDNWAEALKNPAAPVPEGVIDPQGRPAGKRFNVYRNNVVVSLKDALKGAFPVVEALVGAEFFAAMAGEYVRAHPPKNPMLMFYGADFAEFLANFPPVAGLPYLPDVARLELARRHVYHAEDAPVADAALLGTIPPEALGAVTLGVHPAHALIVSDYPVLSIWGKNSGLDVSELPNAAQTVLITRPEYSLSMRMVPDGFAGFVTLAGAGATLGEIAEDLGDTDLFQTCLGLALQTGLLSQIHLPQS